jgi:hypothetical protein
MADDHAEIPERIQERSKKLLLGSADPTTEQHQQIDIRVETEMASPVPTQREHDDVVRGATRLGEQLTQQTVDAIGVAFERGPPAGSALDVGSQL